ncbi:CmcJ/NvfI family oxidoreductase [Sphingomonas mali]|uniref:CmcJ/NvfI family oxidoreductase n=1 Tax=Sphingomonas mali TaxID=40682 RepID=UPI0008379259|nr:CmcJ/NvfI family oxidoreductase [Sphingomonas mali]
MTTLLNRSTAAPAIETTIDYLVPTSRINRRFWAPGREFNTGVYQSYPVTIRNARLAPDPFTLDQHGFCLARHASRVTDFRDPAAVVDYPGEVAEVARALTGCDLVVPMVGQLRSPVISGAGIQPPAAEAHVDFNTATAHRIAGRLFEKAAPGASFSRFIAFSLWRTFSPPPQDWPLALCEAGSVGDEDAVANVKVDVDEIPEGDALYAPIEGEEDMAAATIFHHNPAHRWWYFPDMTAEEVIFIKFHDSDHDWAWRAPHTAFHDTTRPDAVTRESYEFRAIAYFT